MKLVFFGDSLTQGTFGVSYVSKIAAVLPGHHFVNMGINGDTSLNLYRRVDRDVLAEKPDGVLIMVGINDALSAVEPGARPYYRLAKGVPKGQLSPLAFRENIRAILTKCLAAGIKTWVALPPIEYRPEVVTALRQMNDYAAEVAAEHRIPVLDVMAVLTPPTVPQRPPMGLAQYRLNLEHVLGAKQYDNWRDAGNFTYSFDGIHLTESGAAQIAALLTPFLRANGVN